MHKPHPEERPSGRVSKDGLMHHRGLMVRDAATRLLTTRVWHSLHQRTSAIRDRAKRLVGGDGRDQLVIVVRILRLLRLLHLEQVHRMGDATVLTDGDVAEQLV